MTLELGSLERALAALDRSVHAARAYEEMPQVDEEFREVVRAGVIQCFEVAYEQCWKFVQRWIRENQSPEEAENPRTRKDLFRAAARLGLVGDPLPWFEYAGARNLASHTYDEETAASVFEAAKRFCADGHDFLARLRASND